MINNFSTMNYDQEMSRVYESRRSDIHYYGQRVSTMGRLCAICGSKSVGMNFGVVTCAPCKAFFRRNARRKDLLELPCRHRDLSLLMGHHMEFNERSMRYLQIRRCTACRLRRCFEMGMKVELIRSEEENDRYKQLVEINRKRRGILQEQSRETDQLSIPQLLISNSELLEEIDWSHLSNVVYAYDRLCSKTFVQQRCILIFNNTSSSSNGQPTSLTMSIVLAISSFVKSLPAFYSLPRVTRNHLCKTNIRPIIFPNVHELNQSCYAEPWEAEAYRSTWEHICGQRLYKDFRQAESLAERLWLADPVVTRLWIVILFFSTPLHYHDEGPTLTPILKKKRPLLQAQNAYVTLLWKYLVHRHGVMSAIQLYCNLVYVYVKMQTVGFGMYLQLRSQKDLISTNETLNKLVINDGNEEKKNVIQHQPN